MCVLFHLNMALTDCYNRRYICVLYRILLWRTINTMFVGTGCLFTISNVSQFLSELNMAYTDYRILMCFLFYFKDGAERLLQ